MSIAGLVTQTALFEVLADDQVDRKRYIQALSASATIALGGIVVTGLANAWFNVGSLGALTGNKYGNALLFKLALVAIAVLLGGFNRFFVVPSLTTDAAVSANAVRRFTLVVRVEAAIFLGVLIFAAILSATPPPTAG